MTVVSVCGYACVSVFVSPAVPARFGWTLANLLRKRVACLHGRALTFGGCASAGVRVLRGVWWQRCPPTKVCVLDKAERSPAPFGNTVRDGADKPLIIKSSPTGDAGA